MTANVKRPYALRPIQARMKQTTIATAITTQLGVELLSAEGPSNHSPMVRALKNKPFGGDDKPRD